MRKVKVIAASLAVSALLAVPMSGAALAGQDKKDPVVDTIRDVVEFPIKTLEVVVKTVFGTTSEPKKG